jgi:hypothetical protein
MIHQHCWLAHSRILKLVETAKIVGIIYIIRSLLTFSYHCTYLDFGAAGAKCVKIFYTIWRQEFWQFSYYQIISDA